MRDIAVTSVAVLCIAGLIAYALSRGINGAALSSGIAVISGLVGYRIKAYRDSRKQ